MSCAEEGASSAWKLRITDRVESPEATVAVRRTDVEMQARLAGAERRTLTAVCPAGVAGQGTRPPLTVDRGLERNTTRVG